MFRDKDCNQAETVVGFWCRVVVCCVFLFLFSSLHLSFKPPVRRFVPADLLDSGQSMRPVQNEYLQSLTRR